MRFFPHGITYQVAFRPGPGRSNGAQDRLRNPKTSGIEVRGFLAHGGPPRRHGWTQLEKLVRLGPGTNPGTDSEWMLTDPGASEIL